MQPLVDGQSLGAAGHHAKKKSLIASERLTERIAELRRRFIERQTALDTSKLIFIDEAGSNVAMTREHAWAPRGQRVVDDVPRNRGTVTTILGALCITGIVSVMTVEGATDSEVFCAFLEHVLGPKLKPGDVLVLDNVGAHRTADVRRLVEKMGAKVLFLPPYSPDLNPIEECWSKVKSLLRKFGPRTREDLDFALAGACSSVTPGDARGWITHSGYLCGAN